MEPQSASSHAGLPPPSSLPLLSLLPSGPFRTICTTVVGRLTVIDYYIIDLLALLERCHFLYFFISYQYYKVWPNDNPFYTYLIIEVMHKSGI